MPATSSYTGTLTGAPPVDNPSAFGQIPVVPSPGTTSVDVLLSNINNLSNIGTLGAGLTTQGSANAMQPLNAALPGLPGILKGAIGNIGAQTRGQIPPDVLAVLQRQAAERGISSGMGPGSPNIGASYLKSVYDTSTNLMNTGFGNLGRIMGSIPAGPQFNPQTMLTTPNEQQMWQYLANVLKAAPDPTKAAQANLGMMLYGLNRGTGATGPGNAPGSAFASEFRSVLDQAARDQAARDAQDAERSKWAQGNQPLKTFGATGAGATTLTPNQALDAADWYDSQMGYGAYSGVPNPDPGGIGWLTTDSGPYLGAGESWDTGGTWDPGFENPY